jgi:hypothetical protein
VAGRLQVLESQGTGVTDRGVLLLNDSNEFRILSLLSLRIDDKAVSTLATLKRLQLLGLLFTNISSSAAAKPQEALPNTLILHESQKDSAVSGKPSSRIPSDD